MKRLSAEDDTNTASTNVNITSGSITGITDLAVADGGTGASTAAGARTNLGLDSNVVGPASATDNAIARYDGTTGKLVQDSPKVLVDDSNILTFTDGVVGDRIKLFSNTYGIGTEASTLTAWSASQFRWRQGGTSATSGTEKMTLSAATMNIGDGTTSMDVNIKATSYNGTVVKIYSDTTSAYSFFQRFRGTIASPTQVTAGSYIGSFGFRGANETGAINSQDGARFSGVTDEAVTSTGQATSLIMYTAPNNGISTLERFRVSGKGNTSVGVGSDPNSRFAVGKVSNHNSGTVATNGTTTLTGTLTDFTNFLKVGDAITVSGETVRTVAAIASDTSLTVTVAFSTTASGLSYSSPNAIYFRVQANGNIGINQANPQAKLHFGAGTTAVDGIQFGTDTTLYRSAADTLKTDDELAIGINGGKDTLALTDTTADVGITIGADTNVYRSAANVLATDDDLSLKTAGKGLQIKEGSNARMGVSALVGGTVTVSNTSVTANTRIFLTIQSLGTVTVPKAIGVTARTAATSFTITSADATDTSVVAWHLIEPSA